MHRQRQQQQKTACKHIFIWYAPPSCACLCLRLDTRLCLPQCSRPFLLLWMHGMHKFVTWPLLSCINSRIQSVNSTKCCCWLLLQHWAQIHVLSSWLQSPFVWNFYFPAMEVGLENMLTMLDEKFKVLANKFIKLNSIRHTHNSTVRFLVQHTTQSSTQANQGIL